MRNIDESISRRLLLVFPKKEVNEEPKNAQPLNTGVTARPKKLPCKSFFSGKGCTRGASCRYSHDKETSMNCKFFNSSGGCKRGDDCQFHHAAPTKKNIESAPDMEQFVSVRDLGSIVHKSHQRPVVDVCSNRYNTFVVDDSGVIRLYNNNDLVAQQLTLETLVPCRLIDMTNQDVRFVKVVSSSNLFIGAFSIALTDQGKCYSFGSSAFGQLGHGDFTDCYAPKLIRINNSSDYVVVQVECGSAHAVFLTEDGEVYGTGSNEQGQLGFPDLELRCISPTLLPFDNNYKSILPWKIQCGEDHTLIMTRCGRVYGMGRNNRGQLGLQKEGAKVSKPTLIPMNGFVTDISSSSNHCLFLLNDKRTFACGDNNFGQVAAGSHIKFLTCPLDISLESGRSIIGFQTGEYESLLISTGNEILLCGNDMFGLQKQCFEVVTPKTLGIYYPTKIFIEQL
ncbi:RCC2, partial [Acrasis kona]